MKHEGTKDTKIYHYELPAELIATHPARRRDQSRLMIVARDGSPFRHARFADLPDLLRSGDCLVLNDSKVIPARLRARRPGGGAAELLLLESVEGGAWKALVRPARKLRPGIRLELAGGAGLAEILEEDPESVGGDAQQTRLVRFHLIQDLPAFLARHGEPPLPPYILRRRRELGEPATQNSADRRRYQTVYASPPGSVAAPTAGLHFTARLLERMAEKGIEIRRVTLHVGLGTFAPISESRLEDHIMHHERYEIAAEEAEAIERARLDPGRRIVAVGTTSVRALEACLARHGRIQPTADSTDIFIRPGFRFGAVQAMVTNFHLPASTLLLLVAALAGRERILAAYQEAIARRYRFYSYGDAMLIE